MKILKHSMEFNPFCMVYHLSEFTFVSWLQTSYFTHVLYRTLRAHYLNEILLYKKGKPLSLHNLDQDIRNQGGLGLTETLA